MNVESIKSSYAAKLSQLLETMVCAPGDLIITSTQPGKIMPGPWVEPTLQSRWICFGELPCDCPAPNLNFQNKFINFEINKPAVAFFPRSESRYPFAPIPVPKQCRIQK